MPKFIDNYHISFKDHPLKGRWYCIKTINDKYIIEMVEEWLVNEIEGERVNTRVVTDGTDDIIQGRVECAGALLEQIKKWKS